MRLDAINNQWGQREKKIYNNKTDSRGSFSPSCVHPPPPLATGVIILYTGDSVGRRRRRLSSFLSRCLTVCVQVSGSNRSGGETIVVCVYNDRRRPKSSFTILTRLHIVPIATTRSRDFIILRFRRANPQRNNTPQFRYSAIPTII